MSLRKKKRIAILLYVLYATFLTLLIIFGGDASRAVSAFVQKTLDKVNITDVVTSVTEDDVLMAGKYHYVTYTSYGDIRGDDGLEFESLTPEYLKVTGRGRLYATAEFEGEFLYAKVRITSKYDDDFEKTVTFKFTKQYPSEFKCVYFIKGFGNGQELYVGVPVYVSSNISKDVEYNVKTYELEYDERYFTKGEDGCLIPIAPTPEGEKLHFTVRYDNDAFADSVEFTVKEREGEPTDFDSVRFGVHIQEEHEFEGKAKSSIVIRLIKDGEPIATDYTVTCDNADDMEINALGHISFNLAGDKEITLTLPSGFSKTFTVKVRNTLELPTVTDKAISDSHLIRMLDTDVKTYNVAYSGSGISYKNMTFEYDKSIVGITVSGNSFTITPKNHGTTTFKLVIDDGYTRLEDTYTLEIEENKDILALIWKNVSLYVSKVIGHVGLFALLAVVSMYMFRYVYIVERGARFAAYLMTAMPIAVITEIAQTFIPGRYGRVQDVLIDITGFLLGTLFVLVLNKIIEGIMKMKAKTDKKRRDSLNVLRSRKGLNIAK